MERYKNKEWLIHQHQILKKPIKKIAEEIQVNPRIVRYYKEKYDIETPREVRYSGATKYTINSTFFSKIDTEQKAYWLGFIVADGCISTEAYNTKRLSFCINADDKEHLELFKKEVGSDAPVVITETSIKGYSSYEQARLRINSTDLCNSLIDAGITPVKSTKESFPANIPEALECHFWRGFMDGDGRITIYETKGKKQIQLSFVGSEEIISRLHSFLVNQIPFRAKPLQMGAIKSLTLSGKNAIKACNILYKDSTVSLKRKQEKYLEGLQLFGEDIV